MADYTLFGDLTEEVEIPKDGILSRTIHEDEKGRSILFGFSEGQELSEHTASVPASVHILEGRIEMTLGEEDTVEMKKGSWVHMAPALRHSIKAQTPVILLLTMFK